MEYLTVAEKVEMILLYGECWRTVLDAIALYLERFPDRNAISRASFDRVVKAFTETGSVQPKTRIYDEPRMMFSNQSGVTNHGAMNRPNIQYGSVENRRWLRKVEPQRPCSVNIWQNEWNQYGDHLKLIKSQVAKIVYPKSLTRHEQVILCRLRIGHTNLTHLYMLSGDGPPSCETIPKRASAKVAGNCKFLAEA
nr:unnamed protein product [Callosobruchus chinensis]